MQQMDVIMLCIYWNQCIFKTQSLIDLMCNRPLGPRYSKISKTSTEHSFQQIKFTKLTRMFVEILDLQQKMACIPIHLCLHRMNLPAVVLSLTSDSDFAKKTGIQFLGIQFLKFNSSPIQENRHFIIIKYISKSITFSFHKFSWSFHAHRSQFKIVLSMNSLKTTFADNSSAQADLMLCVSALRVSSSRLVNGITQSNKFIVHRNFARMQN